MSRRYAGYRQALRHAAVAATTCWAVCASAPAGAVLLSDLIAGATLMVGDMTFSASNGGFQSLIGSTAANQIDVSAAVNGDQTILTMKSAPGAPFALSGEFLVFLNVSVTNPAELVDFVLFSLSGARVGDGLPDVTIQSFIETPSGQGCNGGLGGANCVTFSLLEFGTNADGTFVSDISEPPFEDSDTQLNLPFSSGALNSLFEFSGDVQFDSYALGFFQGGFGAARPVPEPRPLWLALAGIAALTGFARMKREASAAI